MDWYEWGFVALWMYFILWPVMKRDLGLATKN